MLTAISLLNQSQWMSQGRKCRGKNGGNFLIVIAWHWNSNCFASPFYEEVDGTPFESPVVSIGHIPAFYVVFVPLEYIPTILHHSTYVLVLLREPIIFNICSFTIILINLDIYGLTCIEQWERWSLYVAGPLLFCKVRNKYLWCMWNEKV